MAISNRFSAIVLSEAQSWRKRNMTHQCSHERAPASAHASAHASVHESAHKSCLSLCNNPIQRLPLECSRECSRGCPRKCTRSGLVVCHLVCFHLLCSLTIYCAAIPLNFVLLAAEYLAIPGPRFWELCDSRFAILCRYGPEFPGASPWRGLQGPQNALSWEDDVDRDYKNYQYGIEGQKFHQDFASVLVRLWGILWHFS